MAKLKLHPPFFLFLAWRPSWLEVGITGHIFGRGPSKDYSTKVWLQLAQWFLRRRLKCEMLTDGRRPTDDGRKVMPGELKKACKWIPVQSQVFFCFLLTNIKENLTQIKFGHCTVLADIIINRILYHHVWGITKTFRNVLGTWFIGLLIPAGMQRYCWW